MEHFVRMWATLLKWPFSTIVGIRFHLTIGQSKRTFVFVYQCFTFLFDIWPALVVATNYYVNESVGIACGFLLAAIHHAGLVALTHTPNPMNFLSTLLNRPANERPFLLVPVGYPAPDAAYHP